MGAELQATAKTLLSYELRTAQELKAKKPTRPCKPVDGLARYAGRHCCCEDGCDFSTTWGPSMDAHVGAMKHKRKAREHREQPLWEDCTLQTYFTAKGMIDYFRVTEPESPEIACKAPTAGQQGERVPSNTAKHAGDELFHTLQGDIRAADVELEEKGGAVQDFTASRAERIPWLGRTGFAGHLKDLRDEEVKSSYTLPPKRVLDAYSRGEPVADDLEREDELDLVRILVAAEGVLRDAYELCSDISPARKMTQMRANILNEFYDGPKGKANGFLYFKNESTLTTYFRRMKELLAFYYRVVYRDDGHFTRQQPEQRLPAEVIEASHMQKQAMNGIIDVLRRHKGDSESMARGVDKATADLALQHAVRRLYMALICHVVGSIPFRSPVLSYCAMLSRKVYKKGRRGQGRVAAVMAGGGGGAGGTTSSHEPDRQPGAHPGHAQVSQGIWHEPSNYNSHLSALTWSAQLVLFDYACFDRQDDENTIPDFLQTVVRKFFQQHRETPFGHILQWRLLLFAIGKTEVTRKQARWSLDHQTISYDGLALHMDQVSRLIRSDYRQARSLLYEELLLGARDLPVIASWKLHDDLDREEYGASWIDDPRNRDLLQGSPEALLRQIWADDVHRGMFVRDGPQGVRMLCAKAMALYEVYAQQFMERLSNLVLISGGPAVRIPEHVSITYRNTARRRHLFIWEKLVMIHIQYHKGQEQQGRYKENIRFLPAAVGDLLLTFLTYVQPLRQVFLRQQSPGALLSPFLWTRLDGTLWKDSKASNFLGSGCARAEVPRFQIGWWRQVTASITQEKFSARERANFDLSSDSGSTGGDNEDEVELATLAGMGNHTVQTMHHAYAGTTTLTMTVLLHRAYRASTSWQRLFQVDQALLSGKRPRPGEEAAAATELLAAHKKARLRRRPTGTEKQLLAVARAMYSDHTLQLRVPGQRNGLLATLGPQSSHSNQVVVVLATGSGKTLIFLVGVTLRDAATTILILPTVALRNDMIRRLRTFGIKYHTWTPGSSRSAPLVILTAEAACTSGFLDYARMLIDHQLLDRVVVDECHLTITASEYRESMVQLGWYVGQLKAQTVWLTATLPPIMQDAFILQNKLVRPEVVRESTNRPNIRYHIQVEGQVQGSTAQRAARCITSSYAREDVFQSSKDRMIVFCPTKALVVELAELLDCAYYVGGDEMTDAEKEASLAHWLDGSGSPVIVATSALGPGFDYPHVRLVMHVGAPELLTDFSQESGRAGRDGTGADSVILLAAPAEPRPSAGLSDDQEAMQLYLTQQYCYRGVLSQFCDEQQDWRWCMEGERTCSICQQPSRQRRPDGLAFRRRVTGQGEEDDILRGDEGFSGPKEVLRQDRVDDELLARYKRDFEIMSGCCLYCRMVGRPFEHTAGRCSWRHDWIRAKATALRSCKASGRSWMPELVVCWTCYQPQEICRVADPEVEDETDCVFRDMVMPLSYGKFRQAGSARWFQEHFGRTFRTREEYMLWLGGKATFAGVRCIQANRVAALALAQLG